MGAPPRGANALLRARIPINAPERVACGGPASELSRELSLLSFIAGAWGLAYAAAPVFAFRRAPSLECTKAYDQKLVGGNDGAG